MRVSTVFASFLAIATILFDCPSLAVTPSSSSRASSLEAAAAPKVIGEGLFASGLEDPCLNFYPTGYALPSGQISATVPVVERPTRGAAISEPTFGTCEVRATNHVDDNVTGFSRNDYARRQAFNANNSYFITFSLNGYWHLYNAVTTAYIRVLPSLAGDAEPQWDPNDAVSLYYVPNNGGTKLLKLNVVTGVSTTAADFADRLPWSGVEHIWTKSEGSPSTDARYWCFMAESASFATLGVFTFDLQTQTVLGTKVPSERPDHVSMSPSGRWCTISNLASGGGTLAWNNTFTQSRQLHLQSEHSDLALGANGHDYYVSIDYQSNNGDVFMVDIDTGTRTTLFPTYTNASTTALHVSGKGFSKPGWVVFSTHAGSGNTSQWFMERVFAAQLSANPIILNLAQHQVQYNGYWTEPHASVSRDFSRVLYNSNWGTASDTDVDVYMIHIPVSAIP